MHSYILSCCSTVDLTPQLLAENDIEWVPFHFELDGVGHLDDMGQLIPYHEFYQAMAHGADTKTSQVNIQEFIDHFEPFLEQGKDVLHVSFSSGLSGAVESARIAARYMREKFPERNIIVIDSLCASSGYGLLMTRLAELRDSGLNIHELAKWAEDNKLHVHHWFFSTDLKYYVKGGRISKTAGLVGTALHICPVLNMDKDGKLHPRMKIRTKKAATTKTLECMIDHADGFTEYSGKAFICHSDCEKDAKHLAKLVEEVFPNLDGPVQIFYVGTTIGSHTGPGTVSLFFWGDERTD